ncbi:MAG: DUF4118 domain-containing protein [Bacteroidales bacterium]|nr:DUF4118 domain-containing protein [Bacteroidales bacterium]
MGALKKFTARIMKYRISPYLMAVIIISVTALVCTPLSNTQNYHVVSFILLFVVSILSTFLNVGPVLLAATLSAIVWNYFFIPPHNTFNIEKTEDILIFGLFFFIALSNGVLTTRVRKQEKITREREKRTNALFMLTKELSKSSGIDEVLEVAVAEIKSQFSIEPVFFLNDSNNILNTNDLRPKGMKAGKEDCEIAEWSFRHSKTAGAHTDYFSSSELSFYSLPGTRLNPGVVAVKHNTLFLDDHKSYWDTFLAQISSALEREFLGQLAQKVRLLDESHRLYKTLFNSISHELRIPVATIMGASDSILNSSNSMDIQSALCQEIFTASLRLNRLIENLLNMTRLESGHISVRLDWYDINDLINKVIEDLKDDLEPFSFRLTIPDEMPLIKIDFGLMEQVLYNLLLNSTQHAPVSSEILLNILYNVGNVIIEVIDRGPGFPEEQINDVFNKFFRVNGSKTGGLGLGLSIAKGFIEAHNGSITVENNPGRGAKFTIIIPSEIPDINYF